MNTSKLLVGCYILSLAAFFIGIWSKITHQQSADNWLFVWMLTTIIFVVMAILEIVRSQKIQLSEKLMWVVGFIFLYVITGLLYLLMGRKRVYENNQRIN